MKYWTLAELSQLTRGTLLDLENSISNQLTTMPEASPERREALEILANIHAALSRPMFRSHSPVWRLPSP